MANRKTSLENGEYYHVFNRGVDGRRIFLDERDYYRFLRLLWYYNHTELQIRYSYFRRLILEDKVAIRKDIEQTDTKVDLIAYTLMPNHFHLVIKQNVDSGISTFLANFQNSYTQYFNTRNGRKGRLFMSVFKSVHIPETEIFLHVCRYVHLNLLTSGLITSIDELRESDYSSYGQYYSKRMALLQVETDALSKCFSGRNEYESFHKEQINYQKELKRIKDYLF